MLATADSDGHRPDVPTLYLIGSCDTKIWGMTAAERHARAFRRAGLSSVLPPGQALPSAGGVVMVRCDYVLAAELVQALVETPGAVLAVKEEGSADRLAVAAHVDTSQVAEIEKLVAAGALGDGDHVPANLRVLGAGDLAPAPRTRKFAGT